MNVAGYEIPESEIDINPVRSGGPGGQHVNKVATAIHLRFDVAASSLPQECRERLLELRDSRISSEGVIVIKAQRFRSQEKNREDALQRLADLVTRAMHKPKPRKPTRPTRAAKRRRVDEKKSRGRLKALRGSSGGPQD